MAYKRGPSREGIAKARKQTREERFRRIEQMREKGRKNNKFLLSILITWTDFYIYFLFGFSFQSDIV